VRKSIAIFLFALYTFGATDAYQLMKLPLFVQHYLYHKAMNQSLSVKDFLQIHYNDGPLVIDDDFQQDMQLPFKTTEVEFSQIIHIVIPPQSPVLLIAEGEYKSNYTNYIHQLDLQLNIHSIFQPPRVC